MISEQIIQILKKMYMVACCFGFIGNLTAMFMFSRKKYKNTIFSSYFRILTLIDVLVLLTRIDYFLKDNGKIALRMVSTFFCKSTMYIIYLTPSISSWIMVLISLDRFVSIVMPAKFLFRKQIKYQLLACTVAIVYNTLFSIPVIITYEYYLKKTSSNTTWPKCSHPSYSIDIIDIINSSMIPFVLMLILTLLILRTIFKSRSKTTQTINKKDIRFAITSISLNISFLILKLPHSFFTFLEFFLTEIDESTDAFIYTLLSIFMYSHHGSLFYLTFITNTAFRKEFISLFRNDIPSLIDSHFSSLNQSNN